MAPQTQVRTIIIKNQVQGSKELVALAKRYGSLNKNVAKTSRVLGNFQNLIAGFGAYFGFREVIRAADSFQLLEDRIAVFTGSTQKARSVLGQIADQASFTKSSIETFADGFNRIAVATSDLGFSTDKVLDITTALQQTLRLSGATAAEASSVFLQFSQALSLSRLQGQELRAILLGNATFAKLLADEFNVNVGALRKLGEQGRLTNDRVLKALLDNFDMLNEKAKGLRITIGQALTVAFDQIKIKINDLNQELGLGKGLIKTVDLLLKNLDSIFKLIGIFVAQNVILKLSKQVLALQSAIKAGGLLSTLLNPIALAAAVSGVLALSFALDKLRGPSEKDVLKNRINELQGELDQLNKYANNFAELPKKLQDRLKTFRRNANAKDLADASSKLRASLTLGVSQLTKQYLKMGGTLEELTAKEEKNNATKNKKIKTISSLQELLKLLNAQYRMGSITIEEYNNAITRFKIDELNKKFNAGSIAVDDYNKQLGELRINLQGLQFGDSVFSGILKGASDVQNSIKTLASDIAGATSNAFKALEDQLVDFVTTQKFNFKALFNSIIADLARIGIRRTIISSITGAIGDFGDAEASVAGFANGGVFNNGRLQKFAYGGVVSGPTLFPMANGAGLMGEAGPEAIMPLVRRNGKLGVEGGGSNTVVNIINNSGGDVETRERNENGQQQIDVIINNSVNKAIGEGKFDRTFRSVYGLQRKGS